MKIKISNKFLNCLLAALATGIIFMEYFQPPIKIFVTICAALMIIGIILTWRKKFSVTAKIIFPIIFFAIGATRFFAVDHLPPNDISNFEGKNIFISGTVRDDPTTKILPNNLNQLRLVVDVESVKSQGKTFQTSGAMILTAYKNSDENFSTVRIGDKVFAEGNLKLITNYKNPGQIDSVTRMKSDGITARMSAGKNGIEIESVDGNFWTKFLRLVAQIRQHYRAAMSNVMSNEDAAAIFAMLFGGYAGLNPELVEEFQITGIVHILSVSGSHMSLLAIVTAYLCQILKCPRIFTLALGIFVIGTYTILSGFLPQVIRSAIMGFLVFTATALEVEALGARFLAFAAISMLIVKPLLIFDVSFQLSFSSTAGLIYLAPQMKSWLEKFIIQNSKFLILIAPATITLSAQIASLPIIIWYFNQVSLSAILANIFVMPFLEIVIIGGLLGGIIALIIPFFGKIIFLLEAIIFSVGAEINRIFANFSFSSIQVPTLGFFAGLIYYVALIFRRLEIFLLLIIVLIFNFKSSGELEVNFIDVGQGDCAVVFTPNRKCLIFDTGGVREKVFDIGGRVVVPYLKHENIREVEYIFLTHVHEDHAGGAGAIIKKFPVREIVTAGEPKSEYAAVFGISENFLENLHAGHQNEKFEIDGVEVEIIFAPTVGIVYKISYGDITFLITGDLIIENEEEILREKINVASTVLKVGHHGSKTSSSEEFLRAVNPKVAVISVGYGNNFGHPRPEVLERLNNLGVKIFRTDKDGLIKFKTDGKKLSAESFFRE